jgi:hypothetical protein
MTKKLTYVMAAVLALSIASTASAALSQAEIRQWYGGSQLNNPGENTPFGAGVPGNPVIQAFPGDTVYISIWAKAALGDKTGGFTAITAYNYEQYGVGMGSFSYAASHTRDNLGAYSGEVDGGMGSGLAHDNCPEMLQLVSLMGAVSATESEVMRSDDNDDGSGSGPGFDDDDNDAYFLGWVAIQVGDSATAGDELQLFFSTPDDSANKYATNSTVGSLNTVGYGHTEDGVTPNTARCDNTNLDVFGTVNDRASSVADAVIEVVPEPTTMGLLALGLLAIRRRRAA